MITIECPHCYEPLSIPDMLDRIKCPACGKVSRLSVDAEYYNGSWHDLSCLTTEPTNESPISN